MTENEAIKIINDKYETFFALSTTNDFDMAMATAIKALEEIQSYRAIGTVEEFKALKENQFFNFDSPVARVDKKSYDKGIDDLCNEFHKDWEEQSENDMEDCINWYDWLIACAEQLKGE